MAHEANKIYAAVTTFKYKRQILKKKQLKKKKKRISLYSIWCNLFRFSHLCDKFNAVLFPEKSALGKSWNTGKTNSKQLAVMLCRVGYHSSQKEIDCCSASIT